MKMTSTSNINFSLILSLILSLACLVIVFVGGWYFQSSLVEEKVKTDVQGEVIQMLKETVEEQKEQLNQLKIQLETLKNQFEIDLQASGEVVSSNNATKRNIHKRAADTFQCNEGTIIIKGRDGRDGRDGQPGPPGPTGPKGDIGPIGPAGGTGGGPLQGGVVYVRWGNDTCPDTGAELVYSGRAGGSHYTHQGGGGNPQCLPIDPEFLDTIDGRQNSAFIYGAEYEMTNQIVEDSVNTDVACAVCYVPKRNTVYMLPAKYTCPAGWTREYHGYLMSERFNYHRSTFSCVDQSLTPVIGSNTNHNGFLFYPVQGSCGALPCPPYDDTSELSCAVCTK